MSVCQFVSLSVCQFVSWLVGWWEGEDVIEQVGTISEMAHVVMFARKLEHIIIVLGLVLFQWPVVPMGVAAVSADTHCGCRCR